MVETLGILRSAQDDGRNVQPARATACGWATVYMPSIAQYAMDGAPGRLWLVKENGLQARKEATGLAARESG